MSRSVVVVGAGSAGLAAACALEDAGFEVQVLERGEQVGTSWRSRYEELTLNTLSRYSGVSGRKLPRRLGRWVPRDDYIDYLDRIAAGLQRPVQSNVEVSRIDPGERSRWTLRTRSGELDAAFVVVATGYDRVPYSPGWPGLSRYPGEVHHLQDVRRLGDYAGRRVLVVGCGNSGVDIAGHLVRAGASEVTVSVRTPPTIVPRQRMGVPLNAVAVWGRHLPIRARDAATRLSARSAFGDMGRYGLPPPIEGPYSRFARTGVTIAVDSGFVGYLKAGRIRIRDAVTDFTVDHVLLADGTEMTTDVVILATGYRRGLEPLVGHLGVLNHRGLPDQLPGPPKDAPGLYFVGYRPAVEGTLRMHREDARQLVRHLVSTSSQSVAAR